MQNIEVEIKGDIAILKVNLKQTHGISRSGKSIIIASTEGNVKVEGTEDVMFGLNVYRANK